MAIGSYIDEHGHLLYLHRKVWEWIFIAEALHERDMLRPGRRGVGFGVGREPLAALFASFGCEILATDLNRGDAAEAGWVRTGQYAAAFADLNHLAICDPAEFDRRVAFREVDHEHNPVRYPGFRFLLVSLLTRTSRLYCPRTGVRAELHGLYPTRGRGCPHH
ncbi:MAG: hypothetical protein ACRD1T_01300 [Acidimicrobiia bacterium]